MKKLLSTIGLFLFVGCWFVAAADLQAQLSADTVVAGEPFELTLQSSEAMPELTGRPSEADFEISSNASQGQSTQIINGRMSRSFTANYTLAAKRNGTFTIAPMKVRVGKNTLETPAFTVKVVAAAERKIENGQESGIPLSEAVFAKITVPGNRKSFYLGEEVPVEVRFYALRNVSAQPASYPELEIPNAVFRDYRAANRENARFAPVGDRRTTVIDGRSYIYWPFHTAFRSLAPGKVAIQGTMIAAVAEQRRNNRRSSSAFEDSFFDDWPGFGRSAMKNYRISCIPSEELTFLPLPAAPDGAVNLGLIGDWSIDYGFDAPAKPKVGELFSLRVLLRGTGSTETLKAPKLEIPGFRIYPPEVKAVRGGGSAITYAMIPLRPGEAELHVNFAVFDSLAGEYHTYRFDRKIEVFPSDRPAGSVTVAAPLEKSETPAADDAKNNGDEPRSALIYLKNTPSGAVSLPVWKEHLWIAAAIFALGPILWILLEWRRGRAAAHAADGNYHRRENARRRRRAVTAALRQAGEAAELDAVVNRELVPMLADYLGLPPGSTALELAEAVSEKPFADALRQSGEGAYRPGAETTSVEERRKSLLAGLKKVMIWAVLLLGCSAFAAPETMWERGVAAYDKGDFRQALADFAALRSAAEPDAALEYNIGCAEYMLQDYPAALHAFERAHRLAPRSADALGNLNLTRGKLGLPETGQVASPGDLIVFGRDSLLPGEWLVLMACAFLALMLALTFRLRLGRYAVRALSAAALLGFLLAGGAMVSELLGPYHESRAIAAGSGAELRSLPGASGRVEGRIPGGQEVRMIERRADFTLIRQGKREGWTPNRSLLPLWNTSK